MPALAIRNREYFILQMILLAHSFKKEIIIYLAVREVPGDSSHHWLCLTQTSFTCFNQRISVISRKLKYGRKMLCLQNQINPGLRNDLSLSLGSLPVTFYQYLPPYSASFRSINMKFALRTSKHIEAPHSCKL